MRIIYIYICFTTVNFMSAILSADDLNDFISPGVACIKPVEVIPETEIQTGSQGEVLEVTKETGQSQALQQAQISLSDCLACSGCITSAEEVLVAQHSHKELLNSLKDPSNREKVFVASISHQSRASIAQAFSLSYEECDKFLLKLFVERLGFKYVVGLGLGRRISNMYTAKDVIDRKSATPVLGSACPGWILYAEKTHPYILGSITCVKSPQQITGNILKHLTSSDLEVPIQDVYHVSIMPCFDKKLEAARPEEGVDVDCVITAKELVQLMQDENIEFDSIITAIKRDTHSLQSLYSVFSPKSWPKVCESWLNDEGSSSGGFALQYLLRLKRGLGGGDNLVIRLVEGRNSDIYNLCLFDLATDSVVGTSSVVNGFRNIQNLVRKFKQGGGKPVSSLAARRKAREAAKGNKSGNVELADPFRSQFVELMACPGGCINGGGQIAGPDGVDSKDWIGKAGIKYRDIPLSAYGDGSRDKEIEEWLEGYIVGRKLSRERVLKTVYKEVEKPSGDAALLLGSKW